MPNPRKRPGNPPPRWRQHLIVAALLAGFAGLGWRVVHLSTAEQAHLRAQGDARHLRQLAVAPQRGRILDRDGRVLAVSTPVESLWANPAVFCAADARAMWQPLLARIDRSAAQLAAACARRADAGFMYIQRRLPPFLAQDLMRLGVPGLALQREYKRFYPGGPAGAQLIGFTDVDDAGQEGLEAAHDASLSGAPGRIRVLKDRAGNYVESVESIRQVRHGKDLTLSIDQRLQALAGDYLEAAVRAHDAAGGSVVALAVPSGEIMAMVNSPQFNPNDRRTITGGAFRNRSVTDVLEPGSTLKPFTAAMALESGAFDSRSLVDTAPGRITVGGHTITEARDHNYGELSLADVVVKSSNVGVTKIALQLPYDELYDALAAAGFGRRAAQLPGEVGGSLPHRTRAIEHATLSYGYGVSATPLQLARAYTVFATDGVLLPVTLQRRPPGHRARGPRVFSARTVAALRAMLEAAASPAGTARQARIERYRIGGKTGTIHKLVDGAYHERRYQSAFIGFAPLSRPRFVVAVVVDEPRGQFHYGGDVAAPVFAKLTADLMRLYNIAPDALPAAAAAGAAAATAAGGDGA